MKQFYSHLIEVEYLYDELDSLSLSQVEKNELKHHVHGSMHYVALDIVLSDLTDEHKKTFIENLNSENYEKLWGHLKENIVDIEEKIKYGLTEVVKEFHSEVLKIKNKT